MAPKFPPVYEMGTPRYAADQRALSCFTGPWAAAAALLQCGFVAEQLFYCRTAVPNQHYFDGHGGLLVKTSNNNLLVMDTAARKLGFPLKIKYGLKEEERNELLKLLEGKSSHPVRFEIPQENALEHDLPRMMQVSTLFEGVAAVHMLHVGLAFMKEQKWEEAAHAFALGLSFNPSEPELLYQTACLAFQRGDLNAAETLIAQSLRVDDGFLYNYFTLGEIALDRGRAAEAKRHFQKFTDDPRLAFGDDGTMKKRATEYAGMSEAKLLADWGTRKQKMHG